MKKHKIAVIGLGYVGLPLAVEFGKIFETVGFDVNAKRVEELKKGIDRTLEVESENLKSAKLLKCTAKLDDIKKCDFYIVAVPTPVDKYKNPDLTPLIRASETVGKVIKKGDIVVYESTVYPGATEEDCIPIIEKLSNLKLNKDFFCGFSPERINPGDKVHTLTTIKKITSGSTPESAEEIDQVYKKVIKAGTHKASSVKVAEAAKVIENSQRDINIAFVNELAVLFDKMGIDTIEVLEAAGTKWNFLPFRPGLVGGHCIGVDPYYLTHKAEEIGYHPEVILAGRRINDNMGIFVANKVIKFMIQKGRVIRGAKVLVLGMTFKENCPDIRNSRVIDIINELKEYGCKVEIFDPWADKHEVEEEYGVSMISEPGKDYDAIIAAVAHNEFKKLDLKKLKKDSGTVVYDVKNILDKKEIDGRL
ncbi:MAG TPA: Vi polysaccharide biosynthesis UDP-N-acetylglucosamine C-6 dehydrogenase TviB [Clostridiales bacterium]|nr:Vi polysaccharide biosynthesis UDP-N-acetylglucosamine C-6 dehydrogenase TviB [Clostridiales bacterium]HQP69968.1 Vi polysaccharide biosynthesis UDP-N-acetylglucosamine C-6 dehydrogenase TviB [Clostridiales bacterium]